MRPLAASSKGPVAPVGKLERLWLARETRERVARRGRQLWAAAWIERALAGGRIIVGVEGVAGKFCAHLTLSLAKNGWRWRANMARTNSPQAAWAPCAGPVCPGSVASLFLALGGAVGARCSPSSRASLRWRRREEWPARGPD